MGFNSISNFFGQAEYKSSKGSRRVTLRHWMYPVEFASVCQVKIDIDNMSACLCILPQFTADGTYTVVDLYFTNQLYQQTGKLCKDITTDSLLNVLLENTESIPFIQNPLFVEHSYERRTRVTGVAILTVADQLQIEENLRNNSKPKSKKSVTDDVEDYNLSFDDL